MNSPFEIRNRLDAEFETESDRGCAILTLCVLEESMVKLLAAILPGGERDARHFMPKGRLSVWIVNAHVLGLIDEPTRDNFKLLTEIRNAFAHRILGGVSFRSPEIHKKVAMFRLPDMNSVPQVRAELESDPRGRFMTAADGLLFTLDWMSGKVVRIFPMHVPTWTITQGSIRRSE